MKEDGIIYLSLKRGKGTKIIKQEIYSNEPLPYYYYEQKEIESLANDLNFKIISSEENNVWVELFLQKINQ